tara:strand:- start:328 stop:588 length:261 start_codon:yes stop_codon:yes gene_type:complete
MSKQIKQYTVVYHEVYGKGQVLNVKYRSKDNLLFCTFGKGKYGFITEKQLRRGDGEITLTPVQTSKRRTQGSLEDALKDLLTGGGL